MAQDIAFCLERAEEAAEQARDATLENVRERARRSEAAWREMAHRAIRIEENRARRADEAARVADAQDNASENGQAPWT